jgi:hypothetical protein
MFVPEEEGGRGMAVPETHKRLRTSVVPRNEMTIGMQEEQGALLEPTIVGHPEPHPGTAKRAGMRVKDLTAAGSCS